MKIKQMVLIGVAAFTVQALQGADQGPNIGYDVLYGVGTGAASLGVFYGAQGYLNETEGRALALSALGGIVISAWLQAGAKGNLGDYLATLATAAGTFCLTKYIYEQGQVPVVTQDQRVVTA